MSDVYLCWIDRFNKNEIIFMDVINKNTQALTRYGFSLDDNGMWLQDYKTPLKDFLHYQHVLLIYGIQGKWLSSDQSD